MSRWQFPDSRLLVFAREPVAGAVKTRLQPAIGEQGCLALYRALLERTMRTVQSQALAPVQLWVDQNPDHDLFLSYCNNEDIFLQSEGDLGRKMAAAVCECFSQPGVDSVILLGTDCPAMTNDHLQLALRELAAGKDVVITPAEDGGYVLLGMRELFPELFRNIGWGGAEVFASTMQRCREHEREVRVLPVLWDIDRPEDLLRLAEIDDQYVQFVESRSGNS